MARVTEIAPDVFQISCFNDGVGLQFNQFLVLDDEPLLYHTLQNSLFEESLSAVKSLIDVKRLRWIGFSHFEADECGGLNRWLAAAPQATALAGFVGAITSVNDFADRPPRILEDGDVLKTGRHSLRFLATPHVPHNWDASLLFEMTDGTLFVSDLLLQKGNPPALVDDVLAPAVDDIKAAQAGPLHDAIPYAQTTAANFRRLSALMPKALAVMHGASFRGDGGAVLTQFHAALENELGI